MGSRFIPLELDLIDEGLFVEQANLDLRALQETILEYNKKHGDRAKNAKAKLTLEITLRCENPDDELFSVKAQIKKSLPARPPSTSLAMASEDEKGACLFVRVSGSDNVTPAQGKLATQDGRTIDPETGKVKVFEKRDKK